MTQMHDATDPEELSDRELVKRVREVIDDEQLAGILDRGLAADEDGDSAGGGHS